MTHFHKVWTICVAADCRGQQRLRMVTGAQLSDLDLFGSDLRTADGQGGPGTTVLRTTRGTTHDARPVVTTRPDPVRFGIAALFTDSSVGGKPTSGRGPAGRCSAPPAKLHFLRCQTVDYRLTERLATALEDFDASVAGTPAQFWFLRSLFLRWRSSLLTAIGPAPRRSCAQAHRRAVAFRPRPGLKTSGAVQAKWSRARKHPF